MDMCRLAPSSSPPSPPSDSPWSTTHNALNYWLIIHGALVLSGALATYISRWWYLEGEVDDYPSVVGIWCDHPVERQPIIANISRALSILAATVALIWWIYGATVLFSNPAGKACRFSVLSKGFLVWRTSLAMWISFLFLFPLYLFLIIRQWYRDIVPGY